MSNMCPFDKDDWETYSAAEEFPNGFQPVICEINETTTLIGDKNGIHLMYTDTENRIHSWVYELDSYIAVLNRMGDTENYLLTVETHSPIHVSVHAHLSIMGFVKVLG